MILKGFVRELPQYSRPQSEAVEWLVDAHARAAATAARDEGSLAKWRDRMNRLVGRYCATGSIGRRYSELCDYIHTDWPRMLIFNLDQSPGGRGIEVRNRFYADTAMRVVESLFKDDTEPPTDLLHVSCTGYASPSAIQRLIQKKGWHSSTRPTQVYHMGCYAALPALRIATGLLCCNDGSLSRRAEIVHTELCTLHFNPGDHSPEQLVIQSLFADGHIRYALLPEGVATIRTGENAFEVLAMREEIVPDSLEDMTWVLSEQGFQMTLSRDVPGKVAACLPRFLAGLFADAGLNYENEAGGAVFAVHPGGPRILDSVKELLGLEDWQLRLSRAVLFERGNMSSATLPHIWMAAACDAGVEAGRLVASMAFGPGLTIAGAIFRKC